MDEGKEIKEPPVAYAPTLDPSRESVQAPQPAQGESGTSSAIATVIKMIEPLPEVAQD